MKISDNDVLKVYLGAGSTGGYQPTGGEDRLRRAYPDDATARMEAIGKYLRLDHLPSNWPQADLAQEHLVLVDHFAQKFPELEETTLHALACYWAYQWR